ncbi:hypothetical protein [uncultured Tissierella sp.]|uniref:hypothetical protein n=1 Tax=uncultured Tissierella sp. TaxID=448160 RepID=UPI0028052A4C|nr:hypothetical protein [uncultured Tissierella sp.]MDU5082252.1 hypothetical protein [Bacillota bacterium]
MTQIVSEIGRMVDMLPEQEQLLVFELIKRMVLAWDSDFTKLTPSEREVLEEADMDLINNEVIEHKDVWN